MDYLFRHRHPSAGYSTIHSVSLTHWHHCTFSLSAWPSSVVYRLSVALFVFWALYVTRQSPFAFITHSANRVCHTSIAYHIRPEKICVFDSIKPFTTHRHQIPVLLTNLPGTLQLQYRLATFFAPPPSHLPLPLLGATDPDSSKSNTNPHIIVTTFAHHAQFTHQRGVFCYCS